MKYVAVAHDSHVFSSFLYGPAPQTVRQGDNKAEETKSDKQRVRDKQRSVP
jgi:hypothetical protein